MGSTLTGQKIKDTYLGFIKTSDSLEVNASGKELTDGNGNDLNVFINTAGEIGFGSTPDYTIDAGSNTDAFRLPNGSTAQQPTGQTGLIRYNTTDSKLEYYDSSFKFIASENYVNTQINNLIDSSPAALDTLNEIAAALNDDPDFYNTITNLINTKQDTVTGAATTIVSSDLTVSRALISNASGKVAVSSVTDTELGYVSGVTSDIQTQIDAKYDKTGGTITGNATITGDLTVDTDTLYVDSADNRVGIGTTSPNNIGHIKTSVNGEGLTLQINSTTQGDYSQLSFVPSTTDNAVPSIYIRGVRGSSPSTSYLTLNTNSTERMRIDSSGIVLINKTASESIGSVTAADLQIGTTGIGASIISYANDVGPAGIMVLGHGRGNSSGLLLNNDVIGQIRFAAGDGTDAQSLGGQISVEVDGTASANDMPSRMVFSTTSDGSNAATERMRIDSSGNVQIGSGTRFGKFDILNIGGSGSNFIIDAGGDNYYTSGASGVQVFRTGSTERMRIDSSGNVGIKESNPVTTLSLGSGSTGISFLSAVKTQNSGKVAVIKHIEGGSGYGDLTFETYEGGSGGGERMRITSGGNVGIGVVPKTGGPTWQHIQFGGTGNLIARKADANVDVMFASNYYINSSNVDSYITTGQAARMRFDDDNIIFDNAGSGSADSALTFTERMRIDSSGNVGIGTTSPATSYNRALHINDPDNSSAELHITAGSGTTASDGLSIIQSGVTSFVYNREAGNMIFGTSNTERMRIDSSGRVGIGTSSPLSKIHIENTSGNDGIRIINSTTGEGYIIFGDTADNITGAIAYNHTSDAMTFDVNNIERMRIDSSGRLGIGTTSPTRDIHLHSDTLPDIHITNSASGAAATDGATLTLDDLDFLINNREAGNLRLSTSGTERMRIDSSGVTKFIPTKAYGDTGSSLKVFGTFTGTNYSDGSHFNLVFGDDDVLNGYIGSITVKQLDASDSTASEMRFYTNAGGGNGGINPNMVINSSGDVGIGTTSPASKIHSFGTGDVAKFETTTLGGVSFSRENPVGNNSTHFVNSFNNADSEVAYIKTLNRTGATTSTGTGYELQLATAGSGYQTFYTNGSERMRITNQGRVGINRVPPAGALSLEVMAPTDYSLGAGFHSTSTQSTIEFKDINTTANYKVRVGSQTDDLVMFAGGSLRMRIDSSGRVGINTSPFTRFTVVGNSAFSPSASGGKATEGVHIRATAGGSGNYGGAISLDTGSIGASAIAAVQESSDADVNGLAFFTHGSGIGADPSAERMRITSGGDVLIGVTNITDATSRTFGNAFSGSGSYGNWTSWGSGLHTHATFRNGINIVGTITTTSVATAYNTSSDYRLKENVVPMEGALDRVDALKPSRFNFIADADKTVDGFLAHEVADVVPEAISGEKDEVDEEGNAIYQGIDQSKLVPLLVGAIQELRAEIETLKSQINK